MIWHWSSNYDDRDCSETSLMGSIRETVHEKVHAMADQ